MNNTITLEELISGYYENEFSQIEAIEKLHFSRRHKRKMNDIFSRFSNNRQVELAFQSKRPMGITRRILIAAIVLILATFLMGSIRSLILNDFNLTEHGKEIHMQAIDSENAPQQMEKYNMLEIVPEGYKRETIQSSISNINILYISGDDVISFGQYTKWSFNSTFIAEFDEFQETEINGYNALILQNDNKRNYVVWDGGDYIYSISANNMNIDEVIELACQNQQIWDINKAK